MDRNTNAIVMNFPTLFKLGKRRATRAMKVCAGSLERTRARQLSAGRSRYKDLGDRHHAERPRGGCLVPMADRMAGQSRPCLTRWFSRVVGQGLPGMKRSKRG